MDKSLVPVVVLLSIAFIASLAVMWVIRFRLSIFLKSVSYKFIMAAKTGWALLCGSGIYLILWPMPQRVRTVQICWFSLLALSCISSAIGFYLYSRDVNSILKSTDYNKPLPAVPESTMNTKDGK